MVVREQVTVDLDRDVLINHTKGKEFKLQPLGDAGEHSKIRQTVLVVIVSELLILQPLLDLSFRPSD